MGEGLPMPTPPEQPARRPENPWWAVRLFDPEMVVGVRVGQTPGENPGPPFVALWIRDREGIIGGTDIDAWLDADEARMVARLLNQAADEIDPPDPFVA